MQYQFKTLQDGTLAVEPSGGKIPFAEHRCTCTLIWPRNVPVQPDNSVIVDPCFTAKGGRRAGSRVTACGADFESIGYLHITHAHPDHVLSLPLANTVRWSPFDESCSRSLADVRLVRLPGHHNQLQAVVFPTADGPTWVVGDAVLNTLWLRSWTVFWRNGYGPDEITATWRSVATVVSSASIVIPGHGVPFAVTGQLLSELLEAWPHAQHREACPDVEVTLRKRLAEVEP